MLLVNRDEGEPSEFNVVFNQRVRADDELCFARLNALPKGRDFLRGFQTAASAFDAIPAFGEDAAGGKKMLSRQEFRGGHERRLRAVFDGDHRCLQRDDGFCRCRRRLEADDSSGQVFPVRSDFGEKRSAPARGLETARMRPSSVCFAHGILPHEGTPMAFSLAGGPLRSKARLSWYRKIPRR